MIEDVLRRIRIERFNRDFSQDYVATQLSISQSFYARIESGKAKLSVEQLFKLAVLFEIEADEFFK